MAGTAEQDYQHYSKTNLQCPVYNVSTQTVTHSGVTNKQKEVISITAKGSCMEPLVFCSKPDGSCIKWCGLNIEPLPKKLNLTTIVFYL